MGRGLVDRAAHLRDDAGILDALRASGLARMILVRGGRARVDGDALFTEPAGDVPGAEWALLGRAADGTVLLLAALAESADSEDSAPEETWLGVRDTAGVLDAHDTELLIEAVALAAWLQDSGFCPRCGTRAELIQAGWARRCTSCQREIFPRTDPAVIVAVESEDGERILLGANAQWRGTMYSCFAGFGEAGESLEQTVHRELEEESGVRLASLRYVSSQPWPYPRSLMLGYRAIASEERRARPDGEEIIDVRWFTRAEIGEAFDGKADFRLPGPASIAHSLIREWYEERG